MRRLLLVTLLLSLLGCETMLAKLGLPRGFDPPEIRIDPGRLVVSVREIVVNLETDCGIGQSLLRRDFDVLADPLGGGEWKILVFLNQIPALRIYTDSGEWECEVASKAFKARRGDGR